MRTILSSIVLLSVVFSAHAERYKYEKQNKGGDNPPTVAANCNPATAATELDINNTRALIQSGGDMWWDFNRARYEIPKGSNKTSLFAGSLWLAGQDISGQFKVAALRFRQIGNDYWTGPLSTVDAEIDQQTCTDYDRHWETSRSMVAEFSAWWEAGQFDQENGTNTQETIYPGYSIPSVIEEWPAHGRNFEPYNEDYYLAPFYDRDGDGDYDPEGDGDYPGYVLVGKSDCSRRVRDIYGDQNIWWVFNDKGNIHTESGGQSIGMEIRAQAFAFATTDEVNNMTFYNYELINRSTFELSETYFGQWVDGDLGNAQDDYVGVDVKRGLGFFYNGDDEDQDAGGVFGYGTSPPAIGVDFFQGPFQANDGKDNCLCDDYTSAKADDGIVYKGQGAGYGDGIIDNERYGMRKFLFHNNASGPIGDPSSATDYYNFLRGIWKDGTPMTFGGNGYDPTNPNAIPAGYMFPGDTDPKHWGTDGVDPGQGSWTEYSAGNLPADRRFVQSSGPFRLGPGAVNNITVGVVWMQASSGGRLESVELMRRADDKTQALFDSCFEILDGPDAPDVSTQELDREVILMLSNPLNSNNYNEGYASVDPFLAAPDSVDTNDDGVNDLALTDKEKALFATYKFEGYQIYQLADGSVGTNDLNDADKARLVAQVDIANGVDKLVNYEFNSQIGQDVPIVKVDGENEGIRHSFRVREDLFSTTDSRLINHKTYYFMAVAYAYNRHGDGEGNLQYLEGEYDPSSDPPKLDGQKLPYLASRKAPSGPVRVIEAIPHKTHMEFDGVQLNSQYGDGIEIERVEGLGNGGNFANVKEDYLDSVLQEFSTNPEDWVTEDLTYEAGEGPVALKVVDPLIIPPGEFTIQFIDTTSDQDFYDLTWVLYERNSATPIDTVKASQTIRQANEQIMFDLGLSLTVGPGHPAFDAATVNNGYVGFDIQFDDESDQWLSGIVDVDASGIQNWIKAGTFYADAQPGFQEEDGDACADIGCNSFIDPDEEWENIVNRTWTPFPLASYDTAHPIPMFPTSSGKARLYAKNIVIQSGLDKIPSVDIVFTTDKSLWTRCAVLEAEDNGSLTAGGAVRGEMRKALSVDKDGRNQLDPDCNVDQATFGGSQTLGPILDEVPQLDQNHFTSLIPAESDLTLGELSTGMGWFPGYAVDIETGQRLNMAFSENSWLGSENGADMQWNPTDKLTEPLFNELRFGGMHMVYVFRDNLEDGSKLEDPDQLMPSYDGGNFMFRNLSRFNRNAAGALFDPNNDIYQYYMSVMRAGAWVGYPVLAFGAEMWGNSGNNHVTIKLRSSRPYRPYSPSKSGVAASSIVAGQTYYVSQGSVDVNQYSINTNGDTSIVSREFFKGQTFEAIAAGSNSASGGLLLIETINKGLPLYNFNTYKVAPTIDLGIGEDALQDIKTVPNPYYAYSAYEQQRLDYLVKIINLPKTCTINIFTVNGTLVRTFEKDDATTTSIDWNLKNQDNITIASGLYIIHINVPGIGEKVIKWFGVLRPIDLNSF
ncbi:MAG: T9SS type A sorting domain-containing protein [Cryomorphaceae bacterium]